MPRESRTRGPPADDRRRGHDWPDLPEPLNATVLATLLDLGLSTAEIADYYHQRTGRVEALAFDYGLIGEPPKAAPRATH